MMQKQTARTDLHNLLTLIQIEFCVIIKGNLFIAATIIKITYNYNNFLEIVSYSRYPKCLKYQCRH